jgi:Mrp family chromosome partitioning ATPase
MPAGKVHGRSVDVLDSGVFADLIGVVSRSYDLVVVDTGPLLPIVDSLEILPLVDAVLLCIRMGQTTRNQGTATRAVLDRLPDLPVGLVITGVSSREIEAYGYAVSDHSTAA